MYSDQVSKLNMYIANDSDDQHFKFSISGRINILNFYSPIAACIASVPTVITYFPTDRPNEKKITTLMSQPREVTDV